MQAVADGEGLELVSAETARRMTPGYDPELLRQAFLMERPGEGETRSAVFELADGYAIVELQSVVDGEITEEQALMQQAYQRRIANGTASEEAMGFIRALRDASIIEVYEERL